MRFRTTTNRDTGHLLPIPNLDGLKIVSGPNERKNSDQALAKGAQSGGFGFAQPECPIPFENMGKGARSGNFIAGLFSSEGCKRPQIPEANGS